MTTTVDGSAAIHHAEKAYEAIRAVAHRTLGATIPAPIAYDILGNLTGLGRGLPQALTQIATGLELSLLAYDLRDDIGTDPAETIQIAMAHLARAAALADQLERELAHAQTAISGQGYTYNGW
jgi:hypothetical protein